MNKHEMTLIENLIVRLTKDGPYYEDNDNICKIISIKYCDEFQRLHYALRSMKNDRLVSQYIDDHMIQKANAI